MTGGDNVVTIRGTVRRCLLAPAPSWARTRSSAPRRRWHGRGLSRARRAPRPRRRGQGAAGGLRERSGRARALRARDEDARRPPPPPHRRDLRRRPATARAPTRSPSSLRGRRWPRSSRAGRCRSRKAIEYGTQIARALAAAHDRGHRPSRSQAGQVIITSDGHIKVLDFGLARTRHRRRRSARRHVEHLARVGHGHGRLHGAGAGARPGGRSSRRHLRVRLRDVRALSGRRAFERASAADTLSAILKEDPAPLSGRTWRVPPALDRVVQRCLEKRSRRAVPVGARPGVRARCAVARRDRTGERAGAIACPAALAQRRRRRAILACRRGGVCRRAAFSAPVRRNHS